MSITQMGERKTRAESSRYGSVRAGKEDLNSCSLMHVAEKRFKNTSAISGTLQEFMCRKLGKGGKNKY